MGGRLLATERRPGLRAPGSASSDLRKVGELCGELRAWIVAAASDRWPFHDDESGALQMPDNAIGDNRSHVFIRVVDTLPAAEQQCESDRFGEVLRFRG
jgi:hypothetical protein